MGQKLRFLTPCTLLFLDLNFKEMSRRAVKRANVLHKSEVRQASGSSNLLTQWPLTGRPGFPQSFESQKRQMCSLQQQSQQLYNPETFTTKIGKILNQL